MESKELTIVIVTFKSDKKIFSCLNSIPSDVSTIVVENSDKKEFKTNIEEKYQNTKCILTGENIGYAAANNIGLKKVDTKYALVLNPDTVLDKDAIKNFFCSVEVNKDFWLIGPMNDQDIKRGFQGKEVNEVNDLKGFAIFFNMIKFHNKFFDENFFLYFEEIDLCKNVKNNGGKIYLDKKIIIRHEGSSSVEKNNKQELEKNRNWHWMWSTYYFHKKHKGVFSAFLIIVPKLISSIIKIIFYSLIFNKNKREIYFFRLNGIYNSIIGKKSWYRPSLD